MTKQVAVPPSPGSAQQGSGGTGPLPPCQPILSHHVVWKRKVFFCRKNYTTLEAQ